MDDIDKLLADLGEPIPLKKTIPPMTSDRSEIIIPNSNPVLDMGLIDNLLGSLDESVKRNVRQQLSQNLAPSFTPPSVISPVTPIGPPMTDLLNQVKLEQDEQAKAELLRQQELEFNRKREEQLKRQRLEQLQKQRRQELRSVAEQWLKQLKPKSEEARWFEEFACNHESRLEAAIEYLEALEEVDHLLKITTD